MAQVSGYLERRKKDLKGKGRGADVEETPELFKYLNGHVNLSTLDSEKHLSSHLSYVNHSRLKNALVSHAHDTLLLPTPSSSSGIIEASTPLERTWRVTQDDIATFEGVGIGVVGRNSLDLSLQFGQYDFDWTRDGRWLLLGGRKGHLSTIDTMSKKLGTEIHVKETTKAVRWLHNTSFFAAAQKKYVYIYDSQGIEIHRLANHIEVNRMEFLPFHFLLATVGNAGYLKYQDTSTGDVVAEHRTKLGKCVTMTQNRHSGFIHLGHSNGTVTLWSPSVSHPQVKLLAHHGPVSAVAVDTSSEGYCMVTGAQDGTVKVWDMRKWQVTSEWRVPREVQSLAFSGKGFLAVGWGKSAHIYRQVRSASPQLYMSQLFPSNPIETVNFRPFEDVLGVGHSGGFRTLIVPGSGEFNMDSAEANPFESKKLRREREIKGVLEKLQPDTITLDRNLIGKLDPAANSLKRPHHRQLTFHQQTRFDKMHNLGEPKTSDLSGMSSAEDNIGATTLIKKRTEADMKGRNKSLKRYLKRKKMNIITKETEAVKAKIKARREHVEQLKMRKSHPETPVVGALSRFQRR